MAFTLCIDFDGVIHAYTSGWKGIDVIPDGPVIHADGIVEYSAIDWLEDLLVAITDDGKPLFDVCIYSSRSKDVRGIAAMKVWLQDHGLGEHCINSITFPTQKPAAFLTIDDRAICFDGHFPSAETIAAFKPWNKR